MCIQFYVYFAMLHMPYFIWLSCSKHHLPIEGVSQGVVKSSSSQKSSVLQIKNAEKWEEPPFFQHF